MTAGLEVSHVFRGGQKDTSTFVPQEPGANGEAPASLATGRFMRSCPPGSRDMDPALLIEAKLVNGVLLGEASVEEWLASSDGQRAVDMFGFSFGQQGMRADVHAVRVDTNRFTSIGGARRWARDHDFRVDRHRVSGGDIVFEQQDAASFQTDGWREVALDRGVRAVIGKRDRNKDRGRKAEDSNADSLDAWLSEPTGA